MVVGTAFTGAPVRRNVFLATQAHGLGFKGLGFKGSGFRVEKLFRIPDVEGIGC